MSNIIHKVKDAVTHKDKSTDQTSDNHVESNQSTNHGPHDSNVANTADPRVDSDRSAHNTTGTSTGHSSTQPIGTGVSHNTHESGRSSNHGPHDSNIANTADSRVDSDRSAHNTTGTSTSHSSTQPIGTGASQNAYESGRSSNHGPHDSNIANTADPRIDSDRDSSAAYGAGSTGLNSGSTGLNSGSHSASTGGINSGSTGLNTGSHTGSNVGSTGLNAASHTGSTGLNSGSHTGPHSASTSGINSDSTGLNTGSHTASNVGSTGLNAASHTGSTGLNTGSHTGSNVGSTGLNAASHTGSTGLNSGAHTGSNVGSTGLNAASHTGSTGLNTGSHSGSTGYGSAEPLTGANSNVNESSRSSKHGPHDSNIANKADPRVDSDRSKQHNFNDDVHKGSIAGAADVAHLSSGNSGPDTSTRTFEEAHETGAEGVNHPKHTPHGAGSSYNQGSTRKSTAGPHDSDVANKLDPRVDSDRDGSKTVGGTQQQRI